MPHAQYPFRFWSLTCIAIVVLGFVALQVRNHLAHASCEDECAEQIKAHYRGSSGSENSRIYEKNGFNSVCDFGQCLYDYATGDCLDGQCLGQPDAPIVTQVS